MLRLTRRRRATRDTDGARIAHSTNER